MFTIKYKLYFPDLNPLVTNGASEAKKERMLGGDAIKRKDFPRAVTHFEKALNWNPELMENWANLADVMMETGAYREVSLGVCSLGKKKPFQCAVCLAEQKGGKDGEEGS